jgi:hypothetical protein
VEPVEDGWRRCPWWRDAARQVAAAWLCSAQHGVGAECGESLQLGVPSHKTIVYEDQWQQNKRTALPPYKLRLRDVAPYLQLAVHDAQVL